jgi:hypothetical protein
MDFAGQMAVTLLSIVFLLVVVEFVRDSPWRKPAPIEG